MKAKVKSLGCAELRSWKWKGTVTGDEEGDLVAEEVGRGRRIAGNTCWAAKNIVGRRTGEHSRECWIFLLAFGANDDRSTHFINYTEISIFWGSLEWGNKKIVFCVKKKKIRLKHVKFFSFLGQNFKWKHKRVNYES